MELATKDAAIQVSPEVMTFAGNQGVAFELPAVVEMTRQLFPRATLDLWIEADPEIADERHIVIQASKIDMATDEASEALWRWHDEIFALCPAPRACVIRLALDGVLLGGTP